jgi:oligopeptidase A
MSNPLLDISALPHFSEITANLIEPAIDQVIKENKEELIKLLKQQNENVPTWQSLIYPLEEIDNRISRVWSPVSHLNSVVNSEELRKAHDTCILKLSEYSTELSQNEDLYKAYKKIKQSDEFTGYILAQKKSIENALLQFKLSGVALDKNKKQLYKTLKQKLSSLKTKYEHNVLDATQEWKLHVTKESILVGLPDYAKAMGKEEAKREKEPGWIFTLDAPSYLAIMMYADNRDLRKEMYEAFSTRASDQGPDAGKFDNSDIMKNILKHRQSLAELLEFNNYAELSIADKMAESTEAVLAFLNDLVDKSRPQAIKEYEELKKYSKEEYSLEDLQAWDVAYFSEKLKQKEYGISQEELKPYFPAPQVIKGLFNIVNRLYGIKIAEVKNINIWHKDVLFYEIKDSLGEVRGQFYLDLFARANKRGGAWMDECVSRMKYGDNLQIPVAYLTCNLTPPVGKDPALLTHNEVTTLFHEFGHGLQHMLTKVDQRSVSGISGVEWDAVELPSQFMENWCWEKEGLALISSHYKTGETLPEELFNKLIKAKNFQSAMFMIRQLEFSIFDFKLHMQYGKEGFEDIQTLLDEVREKVAVVIPPGFNRFQHGFSHIFAGGYSAGYYSYKWAEVLSADAFSKFEQKGIFDSETGEEFLTNILEKGGSEKAMDLFKSFLGREPDIGALLRHSGLT